MTQPEQIADTGLRLADIDTPALVLDRTRLQRNLDAMRARAEMHGVTLRPHLKTAKSVHAARLATAGQPGGITVSTLAEARYFKDYGFDDITYAVPIAPHKIDEAAGLQRDGGWINLLCDNVDTATAIVQRAEALNSRFRVFIEIDCGDARSGLPPESPALLPLAETLAASDRIEVRGVLTHGGFAYNARGRDAIAAAAEQERAAVVTAANRLRGAGYLCPVVAPGSTPTAVFGASWKGCTEIRPGNYMFFDLFQAGLGSCALEDIAVSVLATVIAHRPDLNRMYIDAGGLALSKDTSAHAVMDAAGYGLILNAEGALLDGLYVQSVSQEHGWVAPRDPSSVLDFERYPIGTRLRILPNHSCMTCAAYGEYHVVDGNDIICAVWPRVNGW